MLWKQTFGATNETILDDQTWANVPAQLEPCYAI